LWTSTACGKRSAAGVWDQNMGRHDHAVLEWDMRAFDQGILYELV
jgi:hypothetical protein